MAGVGRIWGQGERCRGWMRPMEEQEANFGTFPKTEQEGREKGKKSRGFQRMDFFYGEWVRRPRGP